MQGGIHHVAAQLLDDADRGAVKQQRLVIVQERRQQLQADIGYRQPATSFSGSVCFATMLSMK